MNNKAIIDMISYYKDEPMVQHTLKVFGYAQAIAAGEGIEGSEKDIIEYAALFHDVPEILTGDLPTPIKYYNPAIRQAYGSGAGPIQERLGAPIAMELAKPYLSAEQVERVGYLVGHHHSFGIKGQRDLQVLFEADWLVNLVESAGKYKPEVVYEKHFVTETGRQFFRWLMTKEKE